jgi:hypothetical protein
VCREEGRHRGVVRQVELLPVTQEELDAGLGLEAANER